MPLYQVDVDGQTVEFDSPVDLTPEQLEAEVSGFRSQIAPPAAPEEAPGYISQLGTSLYQGGRQALGGARTAFNALTGDTADMAAGLQQQAEAQRALQEAQTPEDVAFLEDLNKQAEELKQARGFLPTLSEAIDLPMAALRQPGAAIKTAVQSLPNALISTPITLGAGLVGTAAGGLVGLPTTGPGAVATGIAGGIAAGTAANTALEAGSEIYQRFVERIGDPAGMTREQIAAALDQNPDIASEGLTTGLTRGAVIGTIETLGLKGAGALLAAPERAAIQATRQVLTRSGVDLADDAAVRAAMATPEMAKATKAAADAARAGFNVPARAAGAGAVEIGASGVGEALAQQAVGQETDYADVFLEMLGEGVAAAPSVLAARGVELAGTGIQAVRERVSEQVADNAKADARLDIDDLINNAGENAAIQVNQAVDDAAKVVPAGQPTVEGEMPIEVMPPVTSPTPETQKTSQGTGVIYSPLPAPRPTSALASAGLESDVDLGPIPPEGRTFTSADFGTRGLVMGGASESQLEAMLLSAIKSGREVTLIKEGKPRRMGIRDGNRLVDSDGNRWFPLGALSGGGEFVVGPATAPAPATVSEPTPITPQSLPTGQAQAPVAPVAPVASKADFDALAVGETYISPDGTVWTRRENQFGEPVMVTQSEGGQLRLPTADLDALLRRATQASQPVSEPTPITPQSLPTGQAQAPAPGAATQTQPTLPNAPETRQIPEGGQLQRQDVDEGGPTAEAGGGNRPVQGGQVQAQEVTVAPVQPLPAAPALGELPAPQAEVVSPEGVTPPQPLPPTGGVPTESLPAGQPTSGDVGTALRAVATNTATPEQVASLEAQGLARTVQGQPVITDAGLALMPEAERPRLTEAERVAEIEGQGGVMASLIDTDAAYTAALQGDSGNDNLTELLRAASKADRQKVLNDWITRNPQSAAELQQRVDEAARTTGYDAEVFHGTDAKNQIGIPKINFREDSWKQLGIHVGSREAASNRENIRAQELAREGRPKQGAWRIMPLFLKGRFLRLSENRTGRWGVDDVFRAIIEDSALGKQMFTQDQLYRYFDDELLLSDVDSSFDFDSYDIEADTLWHDATDEQRATALIAFFQKNGYDGIEYDNEFEGGGTSYLVLSPSAIKSADPVTYDDNGNVIPLSQRFQPESPDIRFSVHNTPPANVAPSIRPLQGDQQRNETSARRRRGKAQVPASLRDRDGPPLPNIKVNANDGARAREIEDKQVPGAKDTWIGTAAEYLAEFPDQTAVNDRRVEAFYDAATDRAVILIDRVVARDGDAIRAARNGTSAAVEAVRRLIRHESFVHRGWRALPQNLKTEFLGIAESLVPEEEIEAIVAKGYSRYAGWRTDPAVRALVVEEWLAQRLETLEKLPATDGGPLSRLIDWAKRVWQWLNGNDAVEPTRAELVDVMRQMIRALEIGEKSREVANRGAMMASLTDTDAAYMDAVARGDLETAQRLVDDAWWGGGSKTPHVLLFSKGRYRAFPASYIRLGVPPKGPSGIFQGDKRVGDEKGVSVYAAWKDPKTGTFVIPSAVALDEFGDMDRKIYEVRGSSLRDTGSDDEVLLDPVSVEVVDEVDGLSVVTSSVPYLSLRGEALPENKIPDWKSSEAFALNDTVTYDDAGNVIPLSQRFQPESPDIRFSLTDPTASNIIQDANQTTNEQQPTRSRPLSPETAPGRATEVLPTGEEVVERTQIDKTSMPRLEALAIKFVDSLGPVDTWPNKILNTAWWRANGGNMRDDFGQMVMAEALYRTGIGALQGNPTLVEVNDLISREYQTGATEAAKALASRSYVTTSERYGPMFAVQGMVDQRRRQQETVIDANVDVAAGVDAVNNADAQAQSDASAELDEELRLKDAIYELGLAARTPEIQTRIRRINDNVFRLGVLAQIREQLLSRVQASFVGLSRAAVEQQYASLSVEQIDAEIARLEREVADDVAAVESERQRVRAAPKPKGAAADPITQARTIIARLEADPKTKKTPKANPVRDLYREHLKNPMAEDEFMTRMAGIGVPAAEAQKLYDLAAVKIAATEAVKAQREAEDEAKKLSDAERFAERVINDAAERFADPPIEENGRKDLPNKRKSLSIRGLFNFHVQNGMTLEAFIPAAAQVGLDEATARRLHGAGLLVRDARQSIKTARTEARLDDMAASEAGRLIYETSKLHRQSGYINTPSQAADTIRNVFMEQVKSPVSFEQFAQRLKGLRVDEDLAIRLFNVASRETAARQAMVEERKRQTSIRREIKLGDMAAKEAGRLIYETSKLHRQSGYINTTSPAADTIRKAFMDQVKDPKPFEQFVERLKALRVEEDLATRLFNVADREHTARKAVAYGRRLIERRERLLDAEGSALENLINKLRGKITGDLSWREMFDRPLETQRQWRRDLFAALRNDPALAGLTPQEIGDLVVEIDKVWEAKRKKNFEAQLKRMNLPGAKGNSKDKIVKSAPKLLRYINAGFFNDAAFRNAISEEFGIPALNEETVKQVVDLMQRAQADGITEVERKGLMLEAIRLMQRDLKAELGDILSNYWVTSVLSGFATQFDMAFSALNGMRVMAQSMADVAIRKREFKLAGRAGMAYLRALGNAILEAARYFYTGDPKLLDNYQYTLNTYLTEGSAAANPFDYFERIIKDPNRPSWAKIMPYFYAGMQRAMTAFDHINSTATTQGMLEMAMFYNRELYEGARMPSKEDVAAARAKAVEMVGGDKTWGQKREVSSYTRQILNELLNKKYPGLLDEARDIGKVVSYTNDPTGIGGIVYHTLLGVTNKYISEAGKYRDEVRAQQEAASRTKRFMANLNYIAAANARNMTGLRFVRFVGNRLNEILSFTPGFGFLRLQEKGMTPTMRAMIIQNQTLGLSLSVLAGVTILRALTDEEDDEKRGFRISGSWSSLPPDKKNQLRASGRSPYAIELWDGKKWISFNYNAWPVASIIATAGNLNDQRLFNPEKWEEKDFEDKLLSAAWAGAFSFKDLSALSGFMDMIGKSAYSTDPVEGATQWLAKFSTNYVGGFVPRMLKDIDLIMDPETRKARDFGAYFAKELPFFRRTEAAGEKLYNIFGEPVKLNRMPWRRAVTATREEPEYETLAELNRRGIFLGAANPSNRTVGSGATRRELTDAEAEKYMVETGKLYRDFIKQQGQSLLQLDRAQAEEVISKTTERLRAAALRMSIGATK